MPPRPAPHRQYADLRFKFARGLIKYERELRKQVRTGKRWHKDLQTAERVAH